MPLVSLEARELMQGVSLQRAADNLRQELALPTYEDCLFFVLFQLRNALTQDCLGPVFGMDGSSAWRNPACRQAGSTSIPWFWSWL